MKKTNDIISKDDKFVANYSSSGPLSRNVHPRRATWCEVKQAFRCKLWSGVACITNHLTVVQQIFMLQKDVASINSL